MPRDPVLVIVNQHLSVWNIQRHHCLRLGRMTTPAVGFSIERRELLVSLHTARHSPTPQRTPLQKQNVSKTTRLRVPPATLEALVSKQRSTRP
eukprot:3359742-Amphidinium_carterae.1